MTVDRRWHLGAEMLFQIQAKLDHVLSRKSPELVVPVPGKGLWHDIVWGAAWSSGKHENSNEDFLEMSPPWGLPSYHYPVPSTTPAAETAERPPGHLLGLFLHFHSTFDYANNHHFPLQIGVNQDETTVCIKSNWWHVGFWFFFLQLKKTTQGYVFCLVVFVCFCLGGLLVFSSFVCSFFVVYLLWLFSLVWFWWWWFLIAIEQESTFSLCLLFVQFY